MLSAKNGRLLQLPRRGRTQRYQVKFDDEEVTILQRIAQQRRISAAVALRQLVREAESDFMTPKLRRRAQSTAPNSKQMVQLVQKFQGNVSAIARAMSKDRTQVRRWLSRYRIDADQFRPLTH
jgi:transcriptional regulator of acetoin/glycerol metabolism